MIEFFLWLLLGFLVLMSLFWTYVLFFMIRYKVPPVPTSPEGLELALNKAELKPGDQVYDLGCGLGHFLFRAQKAQPEAHFTGCEVLRPLVWLNRWRARGKITFVCEDFFKADLSAADVVYCYLWDTIMQQFYTDIWPQLKPGCRVLSFDFPIKKLTAAQTLKVGRSTLYLYIR